MAVPAALKKEELLDSATIYKILKAETDKSAAIIELKMQAKKKEIPARDYDSFLKEQEKQLTIKKQLLTSALPIRDMPSVITNYGDEYTVSEDGISVTIGYQTVQVCNHPIFPTMTYTDCETGLEKVRLDYKRLNTWYSLVVDRGTISTSRKIVELSNHGIIVNDENARYLIKYLADIEKYNEDNIPHKLMVDHLGWVKTGFVPFTSNMLFASTNETNTRQFDKYCECGDFELWRLRSIECFNSPIYKIMISTAYASLILNKLGVNIFGVHLWGETGHGKSVSMLVAASAYGNPSIEDGIVRTGNGTSNGIETIAGFCGNCAVYLDELTTISNDKVQTMYYDFGRGQSKPRMNRGCTAQKSYTWKSILVTNAEKPITSDNSAGGFINRCIQINGHSLNYSDDWLIKTANIFKHNYGFGAKRFLENLDEEKMNKLYAQYKEQLSSKTEGKQANAMAVLLTAFELARTTVYNTDKQLTVNEVSPFLATKEEVSQVLRAYNSFIDWVEANYDKFDDSDIRQAKWGNIKENAKDGARLVSIINIFPERFNDFCIKNGIDNNQFKHGLMDRALIKSSSDNITQTVTFQGKSRRMISIKRYQPQALEEIHGLEDIF